MEDIVCIIYPPFFDGGNEQYITQQLFQGLSNKTIFYLPNTHIESAITYDNKSGLFYDPIRWAKHQALIVSNYTLVVEQFKYLLETSYKSRQITFICVDFWCPGLEQIYLLNNYMGIKANYIGWVHRASWVKGDIFVNKKIPILMEEVWLHIYNCLWYTSNFFIEGLKNRLNTNILKDKAITDLTGFTSQKLIKDADNIDILLQKIEEPLKVRGYIQNGKLHKETNL